MEHTSSFDVFDIMGPIMVGPSSSHTAGGCTYRLNGRPALQL